MPTAGGSRRHDTVLIVCTANQCRSPLAGAILRRDLAQHGLAVRVLDAGLGTPGSPATPQTRDAARRIGLDLSQHRSTRVSAEHVHAADLIVGMERLHVRELALLDPTAWARTYTLKEFVRRGEALGTRPAGEPLDHWLAELHFGRNRRDLLGGSELDDVADPTTDVTTDHETMAAELQDLIGRLVGLVW